METEARIETVEQVSVRAERQRERAEKWRGKHMAAVTEIGNLQVEIGGLYGLESQIAQDEEWGRALLSRLTDAERKAEQGERWAGYYESAEERLSKTLRELREVRSELEDAEQAIRIGNAELARREKAREKSLRQRRAARRDALISEQQDLGREPSDWLERAIRRHLGLSRDCELVIRVGGPAKPKYDGREAYYTTPSGRTEVAHPNAYGYSTIRHPSTLTCTVGWGWVRRYMRRLATAEAGKQVR